MSAPPFVDRIEGEWAVVIIDGRERRVRVRDLPPGAREGVCLTKDLRAIDRAATDTAVRELRLRRERLERPAGARGSADRKDAGEGDEGDREPDDGGDFSL